jgi:hypothetical protein
VDARRGDRAHSIAACRSQVLEDLEAPRGGQHAVISREQGLDDVAAETTGTSCDEPDLGHVSFLSKQLVSSSEHARRPLSTDRLVR